MSVKIDQQKQGEQNNLQLPEYSRSLQPCSTQASEHENAYRTFMKNFFPISKQELISQLQKRLFVYSEEVFEETFRIRAKAYIYNLEIIEVIISYAYFTGQINIINVDAESPIHSTCSSTFGGYGHIYKLISQGKIYAMKCITYTEATFQSVFSNTAMEYFLLKIASALEIGPSMHSPFGFDLVIYSNCIEFAMEFCQYTQGQYFKSDLKIALHKLHTLKIIHYDIKPENINFSEVYGKFVFIDFGLSKIIEQEVGKKTWSLFRGSLVYCSSEMEAAYFESQARLVDLYFNDAECLRKSLQAFHQRLEHCSIEKDHDEEITDVTEIYELMGLKWMFYQGSRQMRDQNRFAQIMKNPLIDKYIMELNEFINNLPSGVEIFVRFYDRFWNKTDREQGATRKVRAQFLKQEDFINDNDDDVFKKRYEQIKHLNSQSLTYNYSDTLEWEKVILLEIENIMAVSKDIYYLKVLEVIQVEDNDYPMSLKLQVSKEFIAREIKSTSKQQKQPINVTLLFFLRHFFATYTNKYSILIMHKLLNSLFFYEVIPQEEATIILDDFLAIQFDLISKLKLTFRFLTSIKWIQGKYKSIYDYNHLESTFWMKVRVYLKSLSPTKMSKLQQMYYGILVNVIQQPLNETSYVKIQDIIGKFKYEQILTLNKNFLQSLYRYLTMREFQHYRETGLFTSIGLEERCRRLAQDCAKKCGISMCYFNQLHVVNFILRKDKLLEFYLRDINKLAVNYSQLKHYSVYACYQMHRFNRNLLCEESITTLIKQVMASPKYLMKLQLFAQFLRIYLVKMKQYEQQGFSMRGEVLRFTLQTSLRMIVPQEIPYYEPHHHQLTKFIKCIVVIFNYIINFHLISKADIHQFLTDFIEGFQRFVNDYPCLTCKYESLMSLAYLLVCRQIIRGNSGKAWEIIVEYAIQQIKNDRQVLNIISILMNLSLDLNHHYSSRDNLVAFFFEFMRPSRRFTYFFEQEINGQQRLMEVYQYLLKAKMYDKLIELLQFIIVYIHSHTIKFYITTFFIAIYTQIRRLRTHRGRNRFYSNHSVIINYFKQKGFNPYNGFYFFILQLSNHKRGLDVDLFYSIAKSINLLSYWCRQLIQNYYYKLILFHRKCRPRKTKFLLKLHYKHRFTDIPDLSDFMGHYKKRQERGGYKPKASSVLDFSLKKYYEHIYIFDFEKARKNPSIILPP